MPPRRIKSIDLGQPTPPTGGTQDTDGGGGILDQALVLASLFSLSLSSFLFTYMTKEEEILKLIQSDSGHHGERRRQSKSSMFSKLMEMIHKDQERQSKKIEKQQKEVLRQANQASKKYKDAVGKILKEGESKM